MANNAFFYYADLERAGRFYQEVLGFDLAADYGMAKIFRLAQSSFLTLVEASKGMHGVDEPKTVTLALVTNEVEGWYEYLVHQRVTMHRPLSVEPGQSHDGFVVLDPEGYFLEFERFNPHPQNEQILPTLHSLVPVSSRSAPHLDVKATILWLYYQDMKQIRLFYESVLGLSSTVDQGVAHIYRASASGFLGTVIAGQGLHPYTEQKAVTVSLLTDAIEDWYIRLQNSHDFRLRSEEVGTRNPRYKAFVGYDPEGYYVEFNTFLEHEDNRVLMQFLTPS